VTLGERLSLIGEHLLHRHVPVYAWAGRFAVVLERLDTLDQSWAQRFEREEAAQPPWTPDQRPGRAPAPPSAWPGSQRWQRPHPGSVADERPRADVPRPADQTAGGEPGTPQRAERALPADVRARLRTVAGPGSDHLRVRTDPTADAAARAQRADAVTIGPDVNLRSGRFRPDTVEGFALLAHETRHVSALLARGGATRRSLPGGIAAEEEDAVGVERQARMSSWQAPGTAMGTDPAGPSHGMVAAIAGRPAGWPPTGVPLTGPPPAGTRSPSALEPALMSAPGAAVPMRADVDRPEAAAPAPFDVDGLRESLIDELMNRVRTDFERGG
jgi:hypothetical protein